MVWLGVVQIAHGYTSFISWWYFFLNKTYLFTLRPNTYTLSWCCRKELRARETLPSPMYKAFLVRRGLTFISARIRYLPYSQWYIPHPNRNNRGCWVIFIFLISGDDNQCIKICGYSGISTFDPWWILRAEAEVPNSMTFRETGR